jgi:hypothetical protein
MSLFNQIAEIARPKNTMQFVTDCQVRGAKFEVSKVGEQRKRFDTQTEARDFAKFWGGLYEVVYYTAKGERKVIIQFQY